MSFELIEYRKLYTFTEKVFLAMGCSEEDARQSADVLLKADLRGIDSHGVARLEGYFRLWEVGRVNTKPQMKIVNDYASTALVDGDRGLGLVTAPYAMKIAIEKAEKHGSGWVAIKNSNHFGIASYHALMAVEKGMIGYALTNASPLVAPVRGVDRMLGTNPICYAFPTDKHKPLIVDMATSAAANGKIEIAQRQGKSIPEGWMQDKDGNVQTSTEGLKEGGSLLPLGSFESTGGHKGYCLGSMVDVFSGVLSGANFGPWVPPFVAFLDVMKDGVGDGIGHFVGAFNLKGFVGEEQFKQRMDKWIETFHDSKPKQKDHPVLVPGEIENNFEEERLQRGIPVQSKVLERLKYLEGKLEIDNSLR